MKRTRMTHKPKRGRKALIAQADGLIQEVCLARDPICQYPECNNRATEGHHIIHRRNFATLCKTKNVIGLCWKHHNYDALAFFKGALEMVCIQWVGGIEAYEALRLYANTGPSEEPGDAVERLKGVLSENTDSV